MFPTYIFVDTSEDEVLTKTYRVTYLTIISWNCIVRYLPFFNVFYLFYFIRINYIYKYLKMENNLNFKQFLNLCTVPVLSFLYVLNYIHGK